MDYFSRLKPRKNVPIHTENLISHDHHAVTFALYSDIDECAANNGGCDTNAICSNTIGSYFCHCKPGYYWSGTNCIGERYADIPLKFVLLK